VARDGNAFKDRAVERLLPPENATLDDASREYGVAVATLERRNAAPAEPRRERADGSGAVATTAAIDEASPSASCRAPGVYPQELEAWRVAATEALAESEAARASPQQTRRDRRRIKELEREVRRKDKALVETAALLVLSKRSRGDLQQGRGRMIGHEDRSSLAREIEDARAAGARLDRFCEVAGINARTLPCWKVHDGLVTGDRRPDPLRPAPAHALSPEERSAVLQVADEPRFADVPPARIVRMLADEGTYLASECTFARILREHWQAQHRGRAKAPRKTRPPTTHVATASRQVRCWNTRPSCRPQLPASGSGGT
jgi:putative transposase